MSNKILVIGNKPYYNLQLNPILDKFERNIRCNFVVPGRNNGNIYSQLALCNHLYLNFVHDPASLERIIDIYGPEYDLNYIHETYAPFLDSINKYANVFHAEHNNGNRQNETLKSIGCPYRLNKIPRTGMTVVLDLVDLLDQASYDSIYLSNFSIVHEVRHSYCLKKEVAEKHYENENSTVHSSMEEIKILQWLHHNKIVDASLCLLEDKPTPTFAQLDFEISDFIRLIVEKEIERNK